MSFEVSPETPQVESTHIMVGCKLGFQGVQSTSSNHQIADLQTSKQQIDQLLIDQLLIYQWDLVEIDKQRMEY